MKNWRVGLASLVFALVGCTKPNPKSCIDGTCTTEQYPFCDVDGSFAGEPQTCIAVDCEPNAFAQCRGDDALSCNAAGTDYDAKQCSLGCQDGVGCRVCQPNETVCENGAVQTCDASGNVVEKTVCPLGCFEDEPRCRNIDPSNALALYADQITSTQDLVIEGGTFDTTTGTITGIASPPSVASITVPNGSGSTIRLFVVHDLTLKDVVVNSSNNQPAAFYASGTITLKGRTSVYGTQDKDPACAGKIGIYQGVGSHVRALPSGGGGNATAGGRSGSLGTFVTPLGGSASGTPELVPLVGGCPSGDVGIVDLSGMATPQLGTGSPGGGAIQFVSNQAIVVEGIVDARGGRGYSDQCGDGGACVWGGGGGGSVLLEAPVVTLGVGGKLIVKGGGGGFCFESPADDTAGPDNVAACGDGNGASSDMPGGNGMDRTIDPNADSYSGGGGGGAGRIRINTSTGSYVKFSTSVEAGVVTTGTVHTR